MAKTKAKPKKKPANRVKPHLNGKPVEPQPVAASITCPACGSDAPHVEATEDGDEYGCSKVGCGWLGTPETAETHRKSLATKEGWMGDAPPVPATAAAVDAVLDAAKSGPLALEELAAYDAETVRLVNDAEAVAKSAESTYENSKAVASEDKKRFEAKLADLRSLIHSRSENRGKRPKPEAPTLLDSIPKWKEYGLDRLTLDDATRAMLTEAGITTLGDLSDQIGPAYADEAPSFGMTREVNDSIREQIHAIIDAEFMQPKTESDLYKQYPIDRWTRFGLTAKDVEKLHAGEVKKGATGFPIITVGDLQRFVTPNPASPGYVQSVKDIKGIGDAGSDRLGEAELQFWGWWRAGGEAEFSAELNPPATEPAEAAA